MTPRSESLLHGSTLMRFVPEAHHARLRECFTEEHFEFGEVIVRQGDPADAFYLLVSGRARVIKTSASGEELALNRLTPGDEFGEAALLDGGTRSASVRASTTVEALRLDRTHFHALANEVPALRESLQLLARWRTLHAFLYEFSNFGRLPAPALRALMAEFKPLSVRKGELIVREGDPAGPMYLLRSGRVWVYSGTREAPIHRAFYRDGEFFGELAMLNAAPRAASAQAVSDCELLLLEVASVTALRQRFPEFDQLLRERVAQYQGAGEARIPIDFAEELLPADARASNKTADADERSDALTRAPEAKPRARIRRFPFVAQIDEMDCGAACFAMVCRHFGRAVSLSRIRELCQTASDGTSLKALCAAGTELGLPGRALKVSPQHLDQLPLPAICHWDGNHWVVVYRVDARNVHIADPARSCLAVPRAGFLKKWTGYTALYDYTQQFDQVPESAAGLSWLWPFLLEHGATLRLAAGLAALVSVLGLLFPVFTQFVVDKVMVDRDLQLLTVMLPAMVATLVFLLLSSMIQQYLLSFVAVRIDSAVLDFLTRRLLALPMSYFKARRTGDIQRRLDGARQLRQFLVASMGPRRKGRGKPACSCFPHSAASFNGAAAKRPRKAGTAWSGRRRSWGFNGAAAKRPRKGSG